MGRETGISWTDATWNPIRGCSRVSEGCRNCYAEGVAYRFSGPGQPYEGLVRIGSDGLRRREWNGQVQFVEKHLLDPLKWKGKPLYEEWTGKIVGYAPGLRVFVNSMSDLFHENVTDEMRDRIFAVMALCPQNTFQVLTKRPARMLQYLRHSGESISDLYARILTAAMPLRIKWPELCGIGISDPARFPLKNVHLGVSCENQATADERIPLLLQTPAAVRFISAEPLLGALDIERYLRKRVIRVDEALTQRMVEDGWSYPGGQGDYKPIDWVICGGESGPGARPMHPDWARSLRDQCQTAGVPFFFKQWGEYAPFGTVPSDSKLKGHTWDDGFTWTSVAKVGTKAAGATLDGREWHEFPK